MRSTTRTLRTLTPILALAAAAAAHGQSTGRLRVTVVSAKDHHPIKGAIVSFDDVKNKHTEVATGSDGTATSGQLQIGIWTLATRAQDYESDVRQVTVKAETLLEIEVDLPPTAEQVVHITARRIAPPVSAGDSGNHISTGTGAKAAAAGTGQNLNKLLRTDAGAVEDSNGQLHVRGEHGSTSVYIDGQRLPDSFQGRAGQIVAPSSLKSVDLITGNFAPEFGGETAAVLDLQLKTGRLEPFAEFNFDAGQFGTYEGGLTMGGEFGDRFGLPDAAGRRAGRFSYLLDVTARKTENAIEPPQPFDQTAHNGGSDVTTFGNLRYEAGPNDRFGLIVSRNPATTQIANRTGLPDNYAPYGQGYGYLGQLSRQQAAAEGILTQEQDGQDINQRDISEFFLTSWNHKFNRSTNSQLSFVVSHAGLDITNNNPAVDLGNLPQDNSIEFNPTLIRNSHAVSIAGNLESKQGSHLFKAGFSIEDQQGQESYELIPASQLALQGLIATDPRLAPVGNTPSVLSLRRTGFYDAGFVQDDWRISKGLSANYGLRLDMYRQTEDTFTNGADPTSSAVDKKYVSPRVNFAYQFSPSTVGRLSFNRVVIVPPSGQGAVLGSSLIPETLSQYEFDLEKQLGRGQSLKFAMYYKDIRNQIDSGLLIPGTQIGAYTSVSLGTGSARGVELSYEFSPKGGVGFGGFLSLTNSIDRPGGVDNTGAPVARYNDHDQLNTIAAGLDYTWKNKTSTGLDIVYGSGLASSQIVTDGPRSPHTEVDFHFSTRPNLIAGKAGLALNVENIFNDRSLLNFNSGFSGTRFQQGRRITLGIEAKF